MTTKPEFDVGSNLIPGLAALALFALMAVVFVQASFGDPTGFGADANITESIGYAMFNIEQGIESESFLIAFEIIDIVLVAALVGAVMLARREGDGGLISLVADGGRELRRTVADDGRELRRTVDDEEAER